MPLYPATTTTGLPAHAGTRASSFQPGWSVYNLKASNTRKLRAKLGAARAGTGLCRIGCFGDSLTAGQYVTAGTTDYPTRLRVALSAARGLVPLFNNLGALGPGWTQTGWSNASLAAPFYSRQDSGGTATYVSPNAGTVLEIATFGVSAAFTYTIDGGSAQTWTPNGQSQPQVITATGLADTVHTVVISSAAGGGTSFLTGACVRGTSGILVANCGLSAATASDWVAAGGTSWFGPANTFLNTALPDVVLLELGMNEADQSISPATYSTSLAALVGLCQAYGADVLLGLSQPPSTTGNPGGYTAVPDAAWDALAAAAYDVADSTDVPLLDVTDLLGRHTTQTTNAVTHDALHLNEAGQQAKATAWAQLLGA